MSARKLILALIVCLCGHNFAWGDDHRSFRPARLTGAWAITFYMSEKPDFLPDTITVLGNFIRDGNFLFSTDIPILEVPMPHGGTAPVKVGEGHGVWKRTGFRKFQLQSTALVQLALEPESLIGFGGGTAEFLLSDNGEEIHGTVRLQLKPVVGEPFPPGIGEVVGRRLFR